MCVLIVNKKNRENELKSRTRADARVRRPFSLLGALQIRRNGTELRDASGRFEGQTQAEKTAA
jgi:hypothetical protein